MHKYIFWLILFGLQYTSLRCQNDEIIRNIPLTSQGNIPDDFRQFTRQKIRNDIEKEPVSTDAYLNKVKKDFFLQSNYIINQLLLSGNVLFGDTVTKYVNEIADEILKDDPELRNKLRIYCLKSTEVNAFTTNQGIIFITLGLLSKLENESQLAYILCHEIIHFKNKHVINTFLKNEELFAANKLGKISAYEKLRLINTYSKELETEADTAGYSIFKKTRFNKIDAYKALEVLQYSHLPFGEFDFTYSFLENDLMRIPENFKPDTVYAIKRDSNYSDDISNTHPNILLRKELIYSLFIKDTATLKNTISKNQKFNFINKLCRYNSMNIYLINQNYIEVLYNSLYLLQSDIDNEFLESCLAKSLYGLSKHKNLNLISEINSGIKYSEGNIYKAHHLIKTLSNLQLNSIVAGHLLRLTKKYPKNKFIHLLLVDTIKDLIHLHQLNLSDYKNKTVKSRNIEDTLTVRDTIIHEKDVLNPTNSDFHLLSFGSYVDSTILTGIFEEIISKKNDDERKTNEKLDQINRLSKYNKRKHDSEEKSKVKNQEDKIESIIFVSPFYFLADERNGLKLLESERKLRKFNNQINKCSDKANINSVLLSPYEYNATDIEKYNEIALLNDWLDENRKVSLTKMIPVSTEYTTNISSKYNCSNISQIGVLNYKKKKENIGAILGYSAWYFPLLPIAIPYVLTPDYYTLYYMRVYNIETGESLSDYQIIIRVGKNYSYINSIMFDYFQRLGE